MSEESAVLIELGACEERITSLQRECARLPGLIEELDAAAQASRDAVQAARDERSAAEKAVREKEAQVQDCNTQRGKFQSQTAMVKTNVEYTALLREIEGMSERISVLEDEILSAMEDIEVGTARLAEVEREQSAIEKDASARAEEQRRVLEQARTDLAECEKEREGLVPRLGAKVAANYERVKARAGTGVANIRDNTCSACHRSIPPETQNRVSAGELHSCANCMRILVPSQPATDDAEGAKDAERA